MRVFNVCMRGIYAYVVCVICLHTRADALKVHRCQHHASIRQNASWPEPREHSVDSCIHDAAPIRGTYLTVLETHMLQLIRHTCCNSCIRDTSVTCVRDAPRPHGSLALPCVVVHA